MEPASRYIQKFVEADLKRKMVLIGGPRQCGKTTLAQSILRSWKKGGLYLNWDSRQDRTAIRHEKWTKNDHLIVLDEIHKYSKWKGWLKGLYDTQKSLHQFLVTGSAKLDVFRKGGDSMLGRYHHWRLHPFCLAEAPKLMSRREVFDRLMTLGGFPEPFFSQSLREAKRWRQERLQRVLHEDIRDLEKLTNISSLDLLIQILKSRVSGQIVYSNLAEDLEVTSPTVKSWIEVCSKMYLIFVVKPYSKSIARAQRKSPKIYFFDNGDVEGDKGQVFENLVATHLLKRLHFLEDSTGDRYELNYIRDKEKREVDFAVVKNNKVVRLIEVKYKDDKISSSLKYYCNRLKVKGLVLVAELHRKYDKDSIEVRSAIDWLSEDLSAEVF